MPGARSSLPSPTQSSVEVGNYLDSDAQSGAGTGESLPSGPQSIRSGLSSALGTPAAAGSAASRSDIGFPVKDSIESNSAPSVRGKHGANVDSGSNENSNAATQAAPSSAATDSNALALHDSVAACGGNEPSLAPGVDGSADGGGENALQGALTAVRHKKRTAAWQPSNESGGRGAGPGGPGRGATRGRGAARGRGVAGGRGPAGRGAGRGSWGSGRGAGRGGAGHESAASFEQLSHELAEMLAAHGGGLPINRMSSVYKRYFDRPFILGGYKLRTLVEEGHLKGIFIHFGDTPAEKEVRVNRQTLRKMRAAFALKKTHALNNDGGPGMDDGEGLAAKGPLNKLTRTFVNTDALEGSNKKPYARSLSPDAMPDGSGDDGDGWNGNNGSERVNSRSHSNIDFAAASPRSSAEKTSFKFTNSLADGPQNLAFVGPGRRANGSRNHSPEKYGKAGRNGDGRSGSFYRRSFSRSRSTGRGRSKSLSHADNSRGAPGAARHSSRDRTARISRGEERTAWGGAGAGRGDLDRRRDTRYSSRGRETTRISGREETRRRDSSNRRPSRRTSRSPSAGHLNHRQFSHVRNSTRDEHVQRNLEKPGGSRYLDGVATSPHGDAGSPHDAGGRRRRAGSLVDGDSRASGRGLSPLARGVKKEWSARRAESSPHGDSGGRRRPLIDGDGRARGRDPSPVTKGIPYERGARRADSSPNGDSSGRRRSLIDGDSRAGCRNRSPLARKVKDECGERQGSALPPPNVNRAERHGRGLAGYGTLMTSTGRGGDTDFGTSHPGYVSLAARPKDSSRAADGEKKPESGQSRSGYASLAAKPKDDVQADGRKNTSEFSDARATGAGAGTGHGTRMNGETNEAPRADMSREGYSKLKRSKFGGTPGDDRGREKLEPDDSVPRVQNAEKSSSLNHCVDAVVGVRRGQSNNLKESPTVLPVKEPQTLAGAPPVTARHITKRDLLEVEGDSDASDRDRRHGSFDSSRRGDNRSNTRQSRQVQQPQNPGASPPRKRHAGADAFAAHGASGIGNLEEHRNPQGNGNGNGRFGRAPGGWTKVGGGGPPPSGGPAPGPRPPGMLTTPKPVMSPGGRVDGARLMIQGTHPAVPERRIHALVSEFGVVGKIEVLEGFVLVHMRSHEEAARAVSGINHKFAPHVSAGDEPLVADVWDEETYQNLMMRDNLRQYADSMRKASSWYEKHKNDPFPGSDGPFPGSDGPLPCRFFALGRGCIFGRNCIFTHAAIPGHAHISNGAGDPAGAPIGPPGVDLLPPRRVGGPLNPARGPRPIMPESGVFDEPPRNVNRGPPVLLATNEHFRHPPQDVNRGPPPRPHPFGVGAEGGSGANPGGDQGGAFGRRDLPGHLGQQQQQRPDRRGVMRGQEMLVIAGDGGRGGGGGGVTAGPPWQPDERGRRVPPHANVGDDLHRRDGHLAGREPPRPVQDSRMNREPESLVENDRGWYPADTRTLGIDVGRDGRYHFPGNRPDQDRGYVDGGDGPSRHEHRKIGCIDSRRGHRDSPWLEEPRARSRSNERRTDQMVPSSVKRGRNGGGGVGRSGSFEGGGSDNKRGHAVVRKERGRSEGLFVGSEEEFGYSHRKDGRDPDRRGRRGSPVSARRGYQRERIGRAKHESDRGHRRRAADSNDSDDGSRGSANNGRGIQRGNGGERGRRRHDKGEDSGSDGDDAGSFSRRDRKRNDRGREHYGNDHLDARSSSQDSEGGRRSGGYGSSHGSRGATAKKQAGSKKRRRGRGEKDDDDSDGEEENRKVRMKGKMNARREIDSSQLDERRRRHSRDSYDDDTVDDEDIVSHASSSSRKNSNSTPFAGAFPESPPPKTTFTVTAKIVDKRSQQLQLQPQSPPPIAVPPTTFAITMPDDLNWALSASPRENEQERQQGNWSRGGEERGPGGRGSGGRGQAGRGRGGRGTGGRGSSGRGAAGRGEGPAGRDAGGGERGTERWNRW